MRCYKCKSYLKHDDNFGYCKKYNCQARNNDNCDIIEPLSPDYDK